MALLQGNVGAPGATGNSDGSQVTGRFDRLGGLAVSQLGAPYLEMAARSQVFSAAIPPGTGQAPGTAIGTTACFTLANPATSGVNLALISISVGYISGTLGAGTLALLAHFVAGSTITAPSGGTAITPTCMKLGSSTASAANVRFNNTVPASGLMIDAIVTLQASLASTATGGWPVHRTYDGSVVIGQGQAVSVQGIAAAGTSPLIVVAARWAEVPI